MYKKQPKPDNLFAFWRKDVRYTLWNNWQELKRNTRRLFKHVFRPKLLRQYPFLEVRSLYSGKLTGENWFDDIPTGWRIMIPCMLEDIVNAAAEDNVALDKCLEFQQIKEKFGGLRLYASATPHVQRVLSIYEALSERLCIHCGRPHIGLTSGWILPYCKACWNKEWEDFTEEPFDLNYTVIRFSPDGEERIVTDLTPYFNRVMKSAGYDNEIIG